MRMGWPSDGYGSANSGAEWQRAVMGLGGQALPNQLRRRGRPTLVGNLRLTTADDVTDVRKPLDRTTRSVAIPVEVEVRGNFDADPALRSP